MMAQSAPTINLAATMKAVAADWRARGINDIYAGQIKHARASSASSDGSLHTGLTRTGTSSRSSSPDTSISELVDDEDSVTLVNKQQASSASTSSTSTSTSTSTSGNDNINNKWEASNAADAASPTRSFLGNYWQVVSWLGYPVLFAFVFAVMLSPSSMNGDAGSSSIIMTTTTTNTPFNVICPIDMQVMNTSLLEATQFDDCAEAAGHLKRQNANITVICSAIRSNTRVAIKAARRAIARLNCNDQRDAIVKINHVISALRESGQAWQHEHGIMLKSVADMQTTGKLLASKTEYDLSVGLGLVNIWKVSALRERCNACGSALELTAHMRQPVADNIYNVARKVFVFADGLQGIATALEHDPCDRSSRDWVKTRFDSLHGAFRDR